MMNRVKWISAILLLLALQAAQLVAEVVPGRWNKVERLQRGAAVEVTLKSGERMACHFVGLSSTGLELKYPDGTSFTVPKAAFLAVTRERKSSRATVLGALIGGAGGALAGVAVSQGFDETFLARGDLMGLTFGAVGAGVGALVGRSMAKKETEVLYRAP